MAEQLGAGRLLIAVYGIFAVSATARAGYQLITEFEQAPFAYSLSALAAAVYIVATYLLANGRTRRLARWAVWFELVGVISVGFLSIFYPKLFNHPSVWSEFGMGYGFVPLVLPIIGLVWLRKINA